MGLIKAAIETIGAFGNAIGNTLSSSWVDYFESGDMTGILMKRGVKIASKGSKNKSGDENIIVPSPAAIPMIRLRLRRL